MKPKILSFITIFAVLVFLTGCPYESSVPLGDPKDSVIDPKVLGTWLSKPDTKGQRDTLIVIRFNDHEYYFESREFADGKPVVNRGRAFITRIKNEKILNFNNLADPGKYFFARYDCSGNRFITTFSSDQYIKQQFSSSGDLSEYFKKHIEKEGFFESGDTLTRISEGR